MHQICMTCKLSWHVRPRQSESESQSGNGVLTRALSA
jgi:hypothetical protein